MHYKKGISIQIMIEVSMLLYSERRNVQCFTLSLPQHVYVLSALLFPRSRPAMLTNGYAFPGNEPEPLIACDLATCPVIDNFHDYVDLKLKPCVRQLLVFRACTYSNQKNSNLKVERTRSLTNPNTGKRLML